ncbi:hypothetical protein H8A97_24765 [Bradyrhizobium sp. Arg62]|uniref:hypothetical protein n=1 Tax=Bradyrhizobium brasilense TaxID=1419277 RepID=UPI001E4D7B93|nr:hypothetical protein [Bradyrhizobium brasilense]MCC8948234.1 hypothetical protein [Bradyrhizobium brasilense]
MRPTTQRVQVRFDLILETRLNDLQAFMKSKKQARSGTQEVWLLWHSSVGRNVFEAARTKPPRGSQRIKNESNALLGFDRT